jgi:hypothetical protein
MNGLRIGMFEIWKSYRFGFFTKKKKDKKKQFYAKFFTHTISEKILFSQGKKKKVVIF